MFPIEEETTIARVSKEESIIKPDKKTVKMIDTNNKKKWKGGLKIKKIKKTGILWKDEDK